MHHFQWLSHIELLWACFYLFRNKIWFTNAIHYTYQARSLCINIQQCSIPTMNCQDSYIFRPSMNKWLSTQVWTPLQPSYSMVIIESNQLWLSSILHNQSHLGILAYTWHYNQTTYPFLTFFCILCRSFTVISSHFLWDKKQILQGNWHDFTKEQWNPFQWTHQSCVGILCLTILLLLLIKQSISRYMTSVYWDPHSECKLHLNVPSW